MDTLEGITWRLARSDDLSAGPALSPAEQEEGRRYRHPERHRQWRERAEPADRKPITPPSSDEEQSQRKQRQTHNCKRT